MEGWIMLRLRQGSNGLAALVLVTSVTLCGPLWGNAQTKPKTTKSQAPSKSTSAAKSQATGKKKGATRAATTKAGTAPAPEVPAAPHRRDPFLTLVRSDSSGSTVPQKLPPGKAGLMISTLRLDGVVRGPNGMIVVVTNPQLRTYFLRQGDRLYDGRVEQISMEGVTFKEQGKDPFNKPIERMVTKRIYPSAGEQ
jgi:hypothetical protein